MWRDFTALSGWQRVKNNSEWILENMQDAELLVCLWGIEKEKDHCRKMIMCSTHTTHMLFSLVEAQELGIGVEGGDPKGKMDAFSHSGI